MRVEDFTHSCPRLFHMAEDGSWPSIEARGLLSTSALLDLYGYEGSARAAVEEEWRSRSMTLRADGLPDVVVRDQKVMPPTDLSRCLTDGLQPRDWYRLVNGKVFFWTSERDLAQFLSAREYRGHPHAVIELSTAPLVTRMEGAIRLTPFNTGSTLSRDGNPRQRGPGTFQRISEYGLPWVKEVAIDGGIVSLGGLVASVRRCVSHTPSYPNPSFEVLESL